jgi:hypothetical protein
VPRRNRRDTGHDHVRARTHVAAAVGPCGSGYGTSMDIDERSRRDGGVTALIEGFFAAGWFGWANSLGSRSSIWFIVGVGLGYALAVAGLVVLLRHRKAPSALNDPAAGRRYGIIVATEFGTAGLGALILGLTGCSAYIIIWVSFTVGVHFFPLAPVLGSRLLKPLGALMTSMAIAGFVVALSHSVVGGQIAGIGSGVALLIFAALALALALAGVGAEAITTSGAATAAHPASTASGSASTASDPAVTAPDAGTVPRRSSGTSPR